MSLRSLPRPPSCRPPRVSFRLLAFHAVLPSSLWSRPLLSAKDTASPSRGCRDHACASCAHTTNHLRVLMPRSSWEVRCPHSLAVIAPLMTQGYPPFRRQPTLHSRQGFLCSKLAYGRQQHHLQAASVHSWVMVLVLVRLSGNTCSQWCPPARTASRSPLMTSSARRSFLSRRLPPNRPTAPRLSRLRRSSGA